MPTHVFCAQDTHVQSSLTYVCLVDSTVQSTVTIDYRALLPQLLKTITC